MSSDERKQRHKNRMAARKARRKANEQAVQKPRVAARWARLSLHAMRRGGPQVVVPTPLLLALMARAGVPYAPPAPPPEAPGEAALRRALRQLRRAA